MSIEIQKKIDEISSQPPGKYHILFNGPSEAAGNFAARLGAAVDKKVYTIHLPTLAPQYIGETEKNYNQAFTVAEQKNWILLFDEADALFGKRTDIQDSHDKYDDMAMSRLLDRITQYNGLVILTANKQEPTDPHLLGYFNTILHFPPKG